MTDDSAFKKQVRARMVETGENYTTARRMVISRRSAVALRIHLNQHVDLELSDETAHAYAAADERGRQQLVNQLLADEITGAGRFTVESELVTDEQLRTEAEDAAIRGAVRRGIERAVGVVAVEVDHAPDRVHVTVRATRPIVLVGPRGAEADRLRGELVELTGKRVRLDIRETPEP